MEAPNRILVLRGGALGDFVLTLPVLASLRHQWPRAHIAVMGYPRLTTLAKAAGLIQEDLSLDSADAARLFAPNAPLSRAWQERLGGFDLAISFLHDPEDVVRRHLMRVGVSDVIVHSPFVQTGHAADHFLKPLAGVGIPLERDACPRLAMPPILLDEARRRMRTLGDRVLVVHPGSGSRKKNWPQERYAALARGLRQPGMTPVFLTGEAESEWSDTLLRQAPAVQTITEPDLVKLACLLATAHAYVGNDSGITHLAAAVGTPVIALFGPSDPAVWGPRGPNVRILCAAEPTTQSLADVQVEEVRQALDLVTKTDRGIYSALLPS